MTSHEPDAYLVERVRQALAQDPRAAELGISVAISRDTVFLTGDVATPERKAVVAEVVQPLVQGRTLQNSINVVSLSESEAEESIP